MKTHVLLFRHALLIAFVFAFTWHSCKKEEDSYSLTKAFPSFMTETDSVDHEPTYADSVMVLGKKLVNPYSIANMRKSLEELKEEWGLDLSQEEIVATHLYVRFLPKDTAELNLLYAMDLELFNYPLDYEILEEGDYYKDPSLPEDFPFTWLYTTVSPNFKFPAVQYEILEEC